MLFRREQHDGIAAGRITRTVRAWRTRKAVPGNRYEVWTVGAIEVDSVEQVPIGELTEDDARCSGHPDRASLVEELRSHGATEPDSLVCKLKRLGLTSSLEVGYQLSPRGRAWMDLGA